MKKKIAILLSALMVLSPLSVFAATNNDLTKTPTNVTGKTLFLEEGYTNKGILNLKALDSKTTKVEYIAEATTLTLRPASSTVTNKDIFGVELGSAEWFFRSTAPLNVNSEHASALADILYNAEVRVTTVVGVLATEFEIVRNPNMSSALESEIFARTGLDSTIYGRYSTDQDACLAIDSVLKNFVRVGDTVALADLYAVRSIASVPPAVAPAPAAEVTKATIWASFFTNRAIPVAAPITVVAANNVPVNQENVVTPVETDYATTGKFAAMLTQIDAQRNVYATSNNRMVGGIADPFTPSKSTYDQNFGYYFPGSKTYIRFGNEVDPVTVVPGDLNVRYFMELSAVSESVSTVYPITKLNAVLPTTGFDEDNMYIPIVALTKAEGDLRIRINQNNSSVTGFDKQFSMATNTDTNTTSSKLVTAKYNFPIEKLIITEKVANSLRDGQIILTAPYGYTWSDPLKSDSNGVYAKAFGDQTLRFAGITREAENTKFTNGTNTKVNFIYYHPDTSIEKRTQLVIDTAALGINRTGLAAGVLSIQGLVLIAEDYAPLNRDILVNIRSANDAEKTTNKWTNPLGGTAYTWTAAGVTKQDVKIGTRMEWGVAFKRLTAVTTLVNGRLTPISKGSEFDEDHKTAKVSFSENVVASWWALRESEFTLTDGAKFVQVKIDEEDNFNHDKTKFTGLNGTYVPQADRNQYIYMTSSKLRIVDLEIKIDKTAYFEMQPWISIESGVEGDIELKAGGNDILKETSPIVIAKAVSPITITAEVKDVKIGYQWQKVSDITVQETAAGRIKRNTNLNIFIDDNITGSDRIAFAPDFITEANSDSKIEFTKPVVNDGSIDFTISRQSYDKAATIKFTNVYVKIDRTVPESNNRPYKVVAGGTAIAANYYKNAGRTTGTGTSAVYTAFTNIDTYAPVFAVKGIGVDFLNVVTPANASENNLLSRVVKVTIGSNKVEIGRNGEETIEMDTEAYISPETNSTMVPVRFVSQALGIPDSQIKWDEELRTVTISFGNKIVQFKIGSSELIINGVTTTMYSPDVPPIKVVGEIKDDRSFLPYRQLAYALDIPNITWDATTQTATYNAHLITETPAAAE